MNYIYNQMFDYSPESAAWTNGQCRNIIDGCYFVNSVYLDARTTNPIFDNEISTTLWRGWSCGTYHIIARVKPNLYRSAYYRDQDTFEKLLEQASEDEADMVLSLCDIKYVKRIIDVKKYGLEDMEEFFFTCKNDNDYYNILEYINIDKILCIDNDTLNRMIRHCIEHDMKRSMALCLLVMQEPDIKSYLDYAVRCLCNDPSCLKILRDWVV